MKNCAQLLISIIFFRPHNITEALFFLREVKALAQTHVIKQGADSGLVPSFSVSLKSPRQSYCKLPHFALPVLKIGFLCATVLTSN